MIPLTHEFIRVVNVNQNHWLTLSNVGCTDSCIKVFNSFGGSPQRVSSPIFYNARKKSITVHYENVQKQIDGNDCGCFALAYATSLCSGIEPSNEMYNP